MEMTDIVTAFFIGIMLILGAVGMYAYMLYRNLVRRVDQMVAEIIQEAEESLVGLDIEIDNGTYFCYNNENKQFVCQGTSIMEVRKAFNQLYPDKTAYLAGGDPDLIERIKAELEALKEQEENENRISV